MNSKQIDPRIAANLSPEEQHARSDAVDMVDDFLLEETTSQRSDALGYLCELLSEDLDQYSLDPAYDGVDDPDT